MSGFGRILEDLNRVGIRYVLIGGIALIRHGVVRATRDVDAILAPEPENLERLRGLIVEWHATRPDGSRIARRERDLVDLHDLETAHGELPDSRAQAPGS